MFDDNNDFADKRLFEWRGKFLKERNNFEANGERRREEKNQRNNFSGYGSVVASSTMKKSLKKVLYHNLVIHLNVNRYF